MESEEHVHVANRQLHFCNDEWSNSSLSLYFFTLLSVPSAAVLCYEGEKKTQSLYFHIKNSGSGL